MDEETYCEGQILLPLEGMIPCYVCGSPTPIDNEEACDSCMNPDYSYYEPANDYAADRDWQDSTWPNER